MVIELLEREDTGHVLLQILKKANVVNDAHWTLAYGECPFFCWYLQVLAAQPEVIQRMTDKDIDQYIDIQIRNFYKSPEREYKSQMRPQLFGFCNVMIRYEFEPFLPLLKTNMDIDLIMHGHHQSRRKIFYYSWNVLNNLKKNNLKKEENEKRDDKFHFNNF